MQIKSIVLVQLLAPVDCYHFLVLVEAAYVKGRLEGDLLLGAALSSRRFFQLLLELQVDGVEVFAFLLGVHEEDVWQLRVILLELLL